MRRERAKPYFILLIALFLIMTLPPLFSDKLRGAFMEAFHPIFQKLSFAKFNAKNAFSEKIVNEETFSKISFTIQDEEIKRLELENKLLYANFIQLLDLVENSKNVKPHTQAVLARVIFRSPNSWFSSLWINIGSEDNQPIGKNSPVLIGNSIIGVIDYLGKKQSRVRLITDSGLTPSVRVLRVENENMHYLAKGELRGAGNPLFRSNGNVLYGVGFNYDFADEKGPSRDLRTGENSAQGAKKIALLKLNDLLVTTGMDGVFPPDLNIARITKIYPLKEGDYYYELEAEATAGKLDDISLVFVLPPVGFDFNDQPPLIGH